MLVARDERQRKTVIFRTTNGYFFRRQLIRQTTEVNADVFFATADTTTRDFSVLSISPTRSENYHANACAIRNVIYRVVDFTAQVTCHRHRSRRPVQPQQSVTVSTQNDVIQPSVSTTVGVGRPDRHDHVTGRGFVPHLDDAGGWRRRRRRSSGGR
jgi:hypothetical protein